MVYFRAQCRYKIKAANNVLREKVMIHVKLPAEYIQYVHSSDVLWGETNYEFGGYFDLEPLDNIEQFNRDIEILVYAPEFVAFASDGGGEVFVFDQEGQIFLLPLIGMDPSAAIKVALSWQEFKSHIVSHAESVVR